LSSLTAVFSSALVCSTHPPVSVSGTDSCMISLADFLGCLDSIDFALELPPLLTIASRSTSERICLSRLSTSLDHEPKCGAIYPTPSPHHSCIKDRNINLFSIDYAFRPRLRIRLTLGGLPLPRNPWVFGDRVFHPVYRYSCRHNHLSKIHMSSSVMLHLIDNASLPLPKLN
jgi:hypothetical protein